MEIGVYTFGDLPAGVSNGMDAPTRNGISRAKVEMSSTT